MKRVLLGIAAIAAFTAHAQTTIPNDPYAISYADVFDNMHYNQQFRPQVHYTPITGQIADATGLILYKGTYHLFHMYDEWSRARKDNKNWGHAVSNDMVYWKQQPQVLNTVLDNRPGSGSGIVDWNNTLKLQSGSEKTLAIYYTDYGRGICLAISKDAGNTWIRHKANPLIPTPKDASGQPVANKPRDPLVFWYQPDRSWRMVLYDDKGFNFYKSIDLLVWTELSRITGFFECPDFIDMSVDGNSNNKKWVIIDGDGSYRIGAFDGTTFTSDMQNTKVDIGEDVYATQSWKHSYDGGEPFVQIGMIRQNGKQQGTYASTWAMQQSVPCELSLKTIDKKVRLCRTPIAALKQLRFDPVFSTAIALQDGKSHAMPEAGDVFEIVATINLKTAKTLTWNIRGEKLTYDVASQQLTFMGKQGAVKPVNNKLSMRIIVDRSSIEAFANFGEVSVTKLFFPSAEQKGFEFSVTGGFAEIESMEVYKLRSIWLEREQELGYQR